MADSIPGYQIEATLHQSLKTTVVRAVREADQQRVAIKVLNTSNPSRIEIAQFQHEFQLTKRLTTVPGVIRADRLERYGHKIAIVMEDGPGMDLSRYLREHRAGAKPALLIDDFLKLAHDIVQVLQGIHFAQIIHKDINPRNILWNERTGETRIIDFGIATELSRERQDISTANLLEGSLPYISPEQTGRVNRLIDYRTDYYSLGATFFELVTGGYLPFTAQDTMGWVYSHIAKTPPSPRNVNPAVPEMIAQVILKLLAKTPEDRYQSSKGLLDDLATCRDQWTEKRAIDPFALGRSDISEKFQIPQVLYGREAETQALLSGFELVTHGRTEMICVTGHSGVGKSSLVHEVENSIVQSHGYFVEGKFDQFERNLPYRAVTQAFQGLIRQILSESSARLSDWERRLHEALGPNGQLILDVLPDLAAVIGPQLPTQEMSPKEAKNRFLVTFRRFIGVFANADHPLVMFLDDLQWSDAATLDLIESLVTSSELGFLYLIAGYRSNEVSDFHPMLLTLDSIKKVKSVTTLKLLPLKPETVPLIVAGTVHREVSQVQELAAAIYDKTQGNPFFVHELLRKLYVEGQFQRSKTAGGWVWDLAQIKSVEISANVVDFMVARIQHLPVETQEALKIAACIGNQFDLQTLARVMEAPFDTTVMALWAAVKEEVIVPLNDQYLLAHAAGVADELGGESASFDVVLRFKHDRIQQAAYALIAADDKHRVHLGIGRLLLKNASQREQADLLLETVRHLNYAVQLITDDTERITLARLNLAAGEKAKASTAYRPALEYLKVGASLLTGDAWSRHFDLAFSIARELLECSYLSGDLETAEIQYQVLLQRAKTNLDKAHIFQLRLRQYVVLGQLDEAIQTGIQALRTLGVKVDEKPNLLAVIREAATAKWRVGRRPIASLSQLPAAARPDIRLAIAILTELSPAAYQNGNENLLAVAAMRQVNLSLAYGNCPESSFAYATYAIILNGIFHDLKAGAAFGQLAVALNEARNDLAPRSRTIWVYTTFTHIWNHPLQTVTPFYKRAIDAGLQSGDLFYLGYACTFMTQWETHVNLPSAIQEGEKYLVIIAETKHQDALNFSRIQQQLRKNLCGRTDGRLTLNDSVFDEAACLEEMRTSQALTPIAIYFLSKIVNHYAYGDFKKALDYVEQFDREHLVKALVSSYWEADFSIMSFLTVAAVFKTSAKGDRRRLLRRLKAEKRAMKRWAAHCPENFRQLDLLMDAELNRLAGKSAQAGLLFDQALEAAITNGFLSHEALINEIAGRFYLEKSRPKLARLYLGEAKSRYALWGADGKVAYLEDAYSNLFFVENDPNRGRVYLDRHPDRTTASRLSTESQSLDVESMLKAARSLSGEVVARNLFAKLMQVLREIAGSNREVLLIADESGSLAVQSRRDGDLDTLFLEGVALESSHGLARSVVQFVARTHQLVVLDNAAVQGGFTQDPYILETQPKSLTCLPLLNAGALKGVLYLENTLSTRAFTSNRLETLRVLAAQAAISIENAYLIANLETKVELRTKELSGALAQLAERTNDLDEKNRALESLAVTDSLTGLFNRHRLDQFLDHEIQRNGRYGVCFSVILLDVDHFKRVNDTHGHQVGDQVLKDVARLLKEGVRDVDVVGRWGGEEFLVICPDTEFDGAMATASHLRSLIAANPFDIVGTKTASFGIATVRTHDSALAILARADAALYRSKANGRNRVEGER